LPLLAAAHCHSDRRRLQDDNPKDAAPRRALQWAIVGVSLSAQDPPRVQVRPSPPLNSLGVAPGDDGFWKLLVPISVARVPGKTFGENS
jgi:hypothetical protein